MYVGKYINGYARAEIPHVPLGWDLWYAWLGQTYINYTISDNGRLRYFEGENGYETDVMTGFVANFINRTQEPFFIYLSPNAPHAVDGNTPPIPAGRHKDFIADIKAPRTPSFDEADVSDKPKWISGRPPLGKAAYSQIDMWQQLRIGSLLAVDDMVEEIIEVLEQTGKLDDTYIIFTSDNGYHLGQHRIMRGKGTPYEESIRVPLVIRGPYLRENITLPH